MGKTKFSFFFPAFHNTTASCQSNNMRYQCRWDLSYLSSFIALLWLSCSHLPFFFFFLLLVLCNPGSSSLLMSPVRLWLLQRRFLSIHGIPPTSLAVSGGHHLYRSMFLARHCDICLLQPFTELLTDYILTLLTCSHSFC